MKRHAGVGPSIRIRQANCAGNLAVGGVSTVDKHGWKNGKSGQSGHHESNGQMEQTGQDAQTDFDKGLLRQRMLDRRNALALEEHARCSREVSERIIVFLEREFLLRMPGRQSERVLAAFMPFGSEIDITPVIEWAWAQRMTVLFPKTGALRAMAFHRIDGMKDLTAGRFGLMEPRPGTEVWPGTGRIDAMLIPGLAFDAFGGRIGYGGGYYDRFLAERRSHGRLPVLIAPAFSFQVVDFRLPVEAHDAKVDQIATESDWIIARIDMDLKNS